MTPPTTPPTIAGVLLIVVLPPLADGEGGPEDSGAFTLWARPGSKPVVFEISLAVDFFNPPENNTETFRYA